MIQCISRGQTSWKANHNGKINVWKHRIGDAVPGCIVQGNVPLLTNRKSWFLRQIHRIKANRSGTYCAREAEKLWIVDRLLTSTCNSSTSSFDIIEGMLSRFIDCYILKCSHKSDGSSNLRNKMRWGEIWQIMDAICWILEDSKLLHIMKVEEDDEMKKK